MHTYTRARHILYLCGARLNVGGARLDVGPCQYCMYLLSICCGARLNVGGARLDVGPCPILYVSFLCLWC